MEKRQCRIADSFALEAQPRHGYDIGGLIELRSGGMLHFHVASLYPMLYRLEKRGWIQGRWIEKADQRRCRYYRLTTEGRRVLAVPTQEMAGLCRSSKGASQECKHA